MTPQLVQIIHIGAGWNWTVYDGKTTYRGVETTYDRAMAAVQKITGKAPVGWELSGRLDAVAGPV